ncbi:maleylpyruvate isomerase family mycothiol-dependent enzyme [Amycolatopsis sp. FDAARGOS 1241]|uniref:maleylpyruvate isomerase family mycothiol-dependent enzyme n=1 Tax=Amycolatopsis sp. FDAARGOS 1241 TaxID=2778070 RepID=UPI0019515687|nr:maleylpyruvate isomerase family mycothiol-dependent enzyme [Amycolatopsis sp. FDAARGOS 1241]QRP48318.1 maleylpyruvate isomerase family mycothiol-dependent enzyme [Amycolatopsis sp. FDAARGOS 1241]
MTTLPLPARDYLPHLRALTTSFTDVARSADAGVAVPDCAGWTWPDLVTHLGNVHRWSATVVRTGEPQKQEFSTPADGDLAGWYAESAAVLLAALEDADPGDRCWHFCGTAKTKAFWFRRQVHETAVHLVDAHRCAGSTPALDPLVSADGVDEVLGAMLPRITRWHEPPPLAAPLTLRATDTGHTWTLVPGALPALGEAEPAAVVEATAQELLTLLWKRGQVTPHVTGDEDLAHAFLKAPLTP